MSLPIFIWSIADCLAPPECDRPSNLLMRSCPGIVDVRDAEDIQGFALYRELGNTRRVGYAPAVLIASKEQQRTSRKTNRGLLGARKKPSSLMETEKRWAARLT